MVNKPLDIICTWNHSTQDAATAIYNYMQRHVISETGHSSIILFTPHNDTNAVECVYDGAVIEAPPYLTVATSVPDHRARAYVSLGNIDALRNTITAGPPFDTPSNRVAQQTTERQPPCLLCGDRISEGTCLVTEGNRLNIWICEGCRSDFTAQLARVWDETADLLTDSL